jgi:hypothetical protein
MLKFHPVRFHHIRVMNWMISTAVLCALASCNSATQFDRPQSNANAAAPPSTVAIAGAITTASLPSSHQLASGKYCYGASTPTSSSEAQVMITEDGQVTGNITGLHHDKKAGRYSSYHQTANGSLTDRPANMGIKVDLNTSIDGRKENTQATWTISDTTLTAQPETLSRIDCRQLGNLAAKAKASMAQ